ncbi:protein of unknown function [Pararobbsia alpina]
MLPTQGRPEATIAITRNIYKQRTILREHGVAAPAGALISRIGQALAAAGVAQLMPRLGFQRPFD